MSAPRTNAHPGTCRRCRGQVPAGEGRLIDQSGGGRRRHYSGARWQVEHLDLDACVTFQADHDADVDARMEARRNSYENRLALWHQKRSEAWRLGVDPDAYAGPRPEEV